MMLTMQNAQALPQALPALAAEAAEAAQEATLQESMQRASSRVSSLELCCTRARLPAAYGVQSSSCCVVGC